MRSNRQRAICLGRNPRCAIGASISPRGARSEATRRVGFRGPEQENGLAEHTGAKVGQRLDVPERTNDLEHEAQPIFRTHLERDETRFPRGDEHPGEGHKPACGRATGRRDQGAMTEQLKQVVTSSTNASSPLREQLPADANAPLVEVADRSSSGGAGPSHERLDALDAFKHEADTGLLPGKCIVGKDPFPRLADLTASQPDPDLAHAPR